ncbi:hypothetical protein [Sphingobacterium sp.]|uniref:hypothetical protein n=1 Tax=Sphingobacterium sp. TaxID=341027 RepID=UPI00289FCB57|nr:hypothetical protein [Sphingobacterium sp.]
MAKLNWQVSPAIVDHYEVVNTSSPILESKIGRVDFRYISLEKANELFTAGTRYLQKIKPKKVHSSDKVSPSL